MTSAQVSIVMPCFNSARHVARSISSVQAQNFADWTLIAVDDGSTDDTAEVIAAIDDSRVRLIRQANAGVSAARNRALEEVRSSYVAFLDSDDTWAPVFLETMLGALSAASPDAVLAYCGWEDVPAPPKARLAHHPPDFEAAADKFTALLSGCPWVIHAALVRSDAVRAAGGFDSRFAVAEDYLMWLRIAFIGRLVRVPRVLAFYHHDASRTQATADVVRVVRQTRDAVAAFLAEQPDIGHRIGAARRRELLFGPGLKCAYQALWSRNLDAAQALFRDALAAGYVGWRDLRYALPAMLPEPVFRALLRSRGLAR